MDVFGWVGISAGALEYQEKWHRTVISGTQEAEARGLNISQQLGQFNETLSQNLKTKTKRKPANQTKKPPMSLKERNVNQFSG